RCECRGRADNSAAVVHSPAAGLADNRAAALARSPVVAALVDNPAVAADTADNLAAALARNRVAGLAGIPAAAPVDSPAAVADSWAEPRARPSGCRKKCRIS